MLIQNILSHGFQAQVMRREIQNPIVFKLWWIDPKRVAFETKNGGRT
jgi:hypothetical protein